MEQSRTRRLGTTTWVRKRERSEGVGQEVLTVLTPSKTPRYPLKTPNRGVGGREDKMYNATLNGGAGLNSIKTTYVAHYCPIT
jgi:hypothetical protein